LEQEWQTRAPGKLVFPAAQSMHTVVGTLVPIVPASQATKPEAKLESIFDPNGTFTETTLLITMVPFSASVQEGCPGLVENQLLGHFLHNIIC
jgi:hypothetical protein